MDLAERVRRVEDELDNLRAIVDGGENQAREAVVVAIGLLVSFAHDAGALDYDRLIESLSGALDPEPIPGDRTDMLLREIRSIVTYHRDAGREGAEARIPIEELIGETERADILRRARASVDFEKDAWPDRPGTDRPHGSGSSNH